MIVAEDSAPNSDKQKLHQVKVKWCLNFRHVILNIYILDCLQKNAKGPYELKSVEAKSGSEWITE